MALNGNDGIKVPDIPKWEAAREKANRRENIRSCMTLDCNSKQLQKSNAEADKLIYAFELSAIYHCHIQNDFRKTLRNRLRKPAITFCLFSFTLSYGKYIFLPFITGEGDKK